MKRSVVGIIGALLCIQSFSLIAAPKDKSIIVTSQKVTAIDVSQSLSLIGKATAENSVLLKSQVAAQVAKILVASNANVIKNQLLIKFNDAKEKAAYDEALAYYNDENRKLKDYKQLVRQSAMTKSELEAQIASIAIAKARLDAVAQTLDDYQIKAPFDGTLSLINFSVGHTASVGMQMLQLDDLTNLRVDLQVPSKYLSKLKIGSKVKIKTQAWPDIFEGTITYIDSIVQESTLNIKVRVNIDNSNMKLKPGMLISATLTFDPKKEIVVPVQAIEYLGTKRFIYVIDDKNIVHKTEVSLGTRVDIRVVIDEGIKVGDNIVVQGLVGIKDGMKVRFANEEK